MITLINKDTKKESVSIHHVSAGIYEIETTDKYGNKASAEVTENQLGNMAEAIKSYIDID
jgi:hypothetical protein